MISVTVYQILGESVDQYFPYDVLGVFSHFLFRIIPADILVCDQFEFFPGAGEPYFYVSEYSRYNKLDAAILPIAVFNHFSENIFRGHHDLKDILPVFFILGECLLDCGCYVFIDFMIDWKNKFLDHTSSSASAINRCHLETFFMVCFLQSIQFFFPSNESGQDLPSGFYKSLLPLCPASVNWRMAEKTGDTR